MSSRIHAVPTDRANPLGHDRKESDDMDRLLHTIPDAQEQLGIGRSTVYELIASDVIQTVKIGRRTLIAHDELQRYVRSLKAGAAAI
jgi:excisionase family DNA binding protein